MENLKCPVCLDYLEKATILRCGHSFCKACLEELDRQRQDRHRIRCPTCRGHTKLRQDRVAGLTQNVALCGLVDAFKREDAAREAREGNNEPNIPAVVQHKSLVIVKVVELTHTIYGMAASSEVAVVVGYGVFRKGSDYISMTGSVRPHLNESVGHVQSIAFLTDGSPVVAQSKKGFRVYNPQGTHCTGERQCKPGGRFLNVCTDKHDIIYAVNGNREIYIFRDGKLERVVGTRKLNPTQICVTRKGHAMIICTRDTRYPSTLSVYDQLGEIRIKSFRVANLFRIYDPRYNVGYQDDDEYDIELEDTLFSAAADSEDRVLVARVTAKSDVFVLTMHTYEGLQFDEETLFKQSCCLPTVITSKDCHMVSLTPSLIAFATGKVLYFMRLAD